MKALKVKVELIQGLGPLLAEMYEKYTEDNVTNLPLTFFHLT
jgi:hypothetical protein